MRRIGLLIVITAAVLLATTPWLLAHESRPEPAPPQGARGRAVAGPPVAPERLQALLPSLPGWEKGEPDGEVINVGLVMSVARVSYEKGDLSLSLEITDTLANPMLMGPFATMMASAGPGGKTVNNVTARTFTVGGLTAVEIWDPREKVADAVVVVNDRFLVKATLGDARDTSAPRALIEAVNLKALAALK